MRFSFSEGSVGVKFSSSEGLGFWGSLALLFVECLVCGIALRMCSLAIECVLLRSNVFSYYSMCPLTIECVLLLHMQQVAAMGRRITVLEKTQDERVR